MGGIEMIIVWAIAAYIILYARMKNRGGLPILGGVLMIAASMLIVVGSQPSYGAPNETPQMVTIGWVLMGLGLCSVIASIVLRNTVGKAKEKKVQKEKEDANRSYYESLETREKDLASRTGKDKFISQKYELRAGEKEGMEALGGLTYAIRSSAVKTKETDWAIAGGIASGLGGPIAGASAAIDAMSRNAQIRADNQKNQAYVNEVANKMVTDYFNELQKSKDWYNHLHGLYMSAKLSTNKSQMVLFKKLNIQTINVTVDPLTGGVEVGADCSNNDKNTWIDGSIRAVLYTSSGQMAGYVLLNLPIGGTMSEGSRVVDTRLVGHCANPKIKVNKYDVKYEPNNLWEMVI